jgi:hypothetical protein
MVPSVVALAIIATYEFNAKIEVNTKRMILAPRRNSPASGPGALRPIHRAPGLVPD